MFEPLLPGLLRNLLVNLLSQFIFKRGIFKAGQFFSKLFALYHAVILYSCGRFEALTVSISGRSYLIGTALTTPFELLVDLS